MFCSNCGNQVNDNTKFCSKCGSRISYNTQKSYYYLNENTSFVKYLLLCIVTLGIYNFLFWPKYIKDLNIACDDNNDSPGYFTVFLLSFITFGIYYFFWGYKQLNRISVLNKKFEIEEKATTDQILSASIAVYIFIWGFGGSIVINYFLIERFVTIMRKSKKY